MRQVVRESVQAVMVLACVASHVSAESWAGTSELLFSNQPAPAASAEMKGLRLVAVEQGPQAVLMPRANRYVLYLPPEQSAEFLIPLSGTAWPRTVAVDVCLIQGEEARVDLQIAGPVTGVEPAAAAARNALRLDPADSTRHLTVRANEPETRVRLVAKTGSSAAAICWQALVRHVGDAVEPLPIALEVADLGDGAPARLPDPVPVIEREIIEWDWRLEDGLGTEREPSSYARAARRALAGGDALLADFRRRGESLAAQRQRWRQLRARSQQQPPDEPEDSAAWQALWREIRWLRREIAFAHPLVRDRPLVFVKQAPSIFSHQLTQYYGACARPGGGIFLLSEPGRSFRTRDLTPDFPPGSYQHLDVSPDGRRLLFAYCRAETTPRDRTQHPDRHYHLYELDVASAAVRAVTDGPYDDIAPRYLPDGSLMFVSTRRGGYHRCGRGPCATYTLAHVQADGSNPRPVSFHETHEWDPAVLHDGRVIYTRWDYVDRHAVHYQQLWTVRADGTDVRIFYGNNTLNPVGIWEARPVPGSNRVMATAAAHHAMTAGSIILVDVTRGVDGPEPLERLTPDALFPESEAPVIREPDGQWYAPVGVAEPPEMPVAQRRWPGHCYRSPCPLSEDFFYAAYSYARLIGEPTKNQPHMFGLYLVDRFGNRELVYRDLNISSLWPSLWEPRSWPGQVASQLADADAVADVDAVAEAEVEPEAETGVDAEAGEGTFLVQDVYASWRQLPPERIDRLRVLQVLPKSTPHINSPRVGQASASPGWQVLGTVPVYEDGSAWFRAPSGIPLAFQALDGRGQAIQIMRSLTYLQPGEQVGCIGCHESRHRAPSAEGRGLPLAVRNPPASLEPGPPGSRPLSYPELVQPVLDAHCIGCHTGSQAEGGVVLTGEPEGAFSVSYHHLVRYVPFSEWPRADFRRTNSEPATQPDFFGSRASPLMRQLRAGHEDVQLSAEDFERLATWMDANALFYGTFDPDDQARQRRGERIAGPAIE